MAPVNQVVFVFNKSSTPAHRTDEMFGNSSRLFWFTFRVRWNVIMRIVQQEWVMASTGLP